MKSIAQKLLEGYTPKTKRINENYKDFSDYATWKIASSSDCFNFVSDLYKKNITDSRKLTNALRDKIYNTVEGMGEKLGDFFGDLFIGTIENVDYAKVIESMLKELNKKK